MPQGRTADFEFITTYDPVSGARVVRLTPVGAACTRNYFYQKAFTTDGKRLVFGADLDGTMDLWLLDLEIRRAVQLTEGGGVSVQGCFLSPDDRFVYFSRGKVSFCRVDVETLREEVVYTAPQGWNCYGTWVANDNCTRVAAIELWEADQVTDATGWERFEKQFHRKPRQRLLDIDLATGQARVVLERELFIGHPMYRPGDDRQMAFCHEGPHDLVDSRIWLVNSDGSGLRQAKEQAPGEACMHEFWVPDGSKMVYVSYTRGEKKRSIWSFDPDTGTNQRLMDMPPCAHLMSNRAGNLLVGDGAGQLGDVADKAGHAFEPDPHLYLFDLARHEFRVLCRHDSTWAVYQGNTQASHPHPSFTPDQRQVLFCSDVSGLPALYLVDVPPTDGLTPDMLPDWYPQAVASLEFPLGWKLSSASDPASWQRRGRQAVAPLLLEPLDFPSPQPEVVQSEAREGYRVDRITLSLGRFRRTSAYLAVPDGPGPFPAALVLHDHGACFEIGKEKMLRPLAGHPMAAMAQSWVEKNYEGRFVADDLARDGWVVLVTDALGWGDRACGGYETQQAVASNLFNLGSSWAGVIASEDLAAAAFLAHHPMVDPARVVSLGHSMGGYRSYQAGALSDHLTATVAICCLATLAGMMVPGGNRVRGQSAFSMTHPGLSRLMDFPDLAALAAPKPLFFLHGTQDRLFPETAVRQACAHIATVYQTLDRSSVFHAEFRPGGHLYSRRDQGLVRDWLDRVLRPV